jgi:hypothetical protein
MTNFSTCYPPPEDTNNKRVQVPIPELPEGVLGISSAELDIDEMTFDIRFPVSLGQIMVTIGKGISQVENELLTAQVFVFLPQSPRIPGQSSLFYGAVDTQFVPSIEPNFDELKEDTLRTVVDVLPRVVSFLNQLAEGATSDSVMDLVVSNSSQVPVVALTHEVPGFWEVQYPNPKEIIPLDSASIVEHVKRGLATHAEHVTKPEKDIREVTVEVVEEDVLYIYRGIGEGDETSYSINLRTQVGSLTCIADPTTTDVSYIFSTRGTAPTLPLDELKMARYSHIFTWISTHPRSLDDSAFRTLDGNTLTNFRSHIDTMHRYIEQPVDN